MHAGSWSGSWSGSGSRIIIRAYMWCGEGQGWDWGYCYCYCYRVGPEVHAATLLCVYPIVLEVQQPD